jgi:hypothetical protein
MGKIIDLTGKKFGKLTVIRRPTKKECDKHNLKKDITHWMCKCECKKIIFVCSRRLLKGLQPSCGCEPLPVINKKHNEYDLSGKYGIGYDRAGKGEFYFDLEDYEIIKEICWCFQGSGYLTGKIPGTRKYILLHRLVMGLPKEDVDHENRIRHDCRKENLRIATDVQNAQNRTTPFTNKSGVAGVSKARTKNKNWRASLSNKGKQIHLGTFKKFKDAVIARLKAELKYCGIDFAPQRHLFKQYGIA